MNEEDLLYEDIDGPPRTNRQTKIVAWVLILTFVLPIVLGLLASALGWV